MGYFAPETLENALSAVNARNIKIVAGGTDFFPTLRSGKQPKRVVNITRVKELRGISKTTDGWRIGAATTWAEIASFHDWPKQFDCLKQAAITVGSVQIQNTATIGGNICNASPAADGVPPLLALGATLEIQSNYTKRTVNLSEFISGVRQIELETGELLTAILLPDVPQPAGSSFVKLGSRKHLVISIAMAAAVVSLKDGIVNDIRIAVGSCSPVAARLTALEGELVGLNWHEAMGFEILARHLSLLSPIGDIRGTADYRLQSVQELCRRAVVGALPYG